MSVRGEDHQCRYTVMPMCASFADSCQPRPSCQECIKSHPSCAWCKQLVSLKDFFSWSIFDYSNSSIEIFWKGSINLIILILDLSILIQIFLGVWVIGWILKLLLCESDCCSLLVMERHSIYVQWHSTLQMAERHFEKIFLITVRGLTLLESSGAL